MNFKLWLEAMDEFSRWKDIILGQMDLDPEEGLSQPLDAWNSHNLKLKLQGLSEFGKLPREVQEEALGMIGSEQGGTIGDLIRTISTAGPRIRV